jgi:hypothetical protein
VAPPAFPATTVEPGCRHAVSSTAPTDPGSAPHPRTRALRRTHGPGLCAAPTDPGSAPHPRTRALRRTHTASFERSPSDPFPSFVPAFGDCDITVLFGGGLAVENGFNVTLNFKPSDSNNRALLVANFEPLMPTHPSQAFHLIIQPPDQQSAVATSVKYR